MNLLSMHSSWPHNRPRSANHQPDIEIVKKTIIFLITFFFCQLNEEYTGQPRVQSAHIHTDPHRKSPSKSPVRRSRYLKRPKSSNFQRSSPLVSHFYI